MTTPTALKMNKKTTAAIEKNIELINNKLLLLEERLNQSTNAYQLDAENDRRYAEYKARKDAEIQEMMANKHQDLMEALKIYTNELFRVFEGRMNTADFSEHISLKHRLELFTTLINGKQRQINETKSKVEEVDGKLTGTDNRLNNTIDRLHDTAAKVDGVIETQSALPGAISKVMHEKITQYADAIYQNLTAQLEEKLNEMDSCYKKNKTVDIDTMKMEIYRKVKTEITEGIKPIDAATKSIAAEILGYKADLQDLMTKWSNLDRDFKNAKKTLETYQIDINNLRTNLIRIDNTEEDHFTTVTASIAEISRFQKRCVVTDAGVTNLFGWITPLQKNLLTLEKNYENLYHEINRTHDTQMDIVKAIMDSTKTYFDSDGDVSESEDEAKDEEVMVVEDVDNPALKAEIEPAVPKTVTIEDKMKRIKKILLRIDKAKVDIPDYIAANDKIPVPTIQELTTPPEPIRVIPHGVEPKHKESCTMEECVGCGVVMHITVYEYLMRICDEILIDVSVKSFKDPVGFCSRLIYCTDKTSFHHLLQREAALELGHGCIIKNEPIIMKTEGIDWYFVEQLRILIFEGVPMPKLLTLSEVDTFMAAKYKENKVISKAWVYFHAICSQYCGGSQRYEYTQPPHIFDIVMSETSEGRDGWKTNPTAGLPIVYDTQKEESKPLAISLSANSNTKVPSVHQYRGLMHAAVTECFRRICERCGIDYNSMKYDILGTNRLLTLGDRFYNTLKYQATRANLTTASMVIENLKMLANTNGHIIDICNYLLNAERSTVCTGLVEFVAGLGDHGGVSPEYMKNLKGFLSVYNFYKPPMDYSILIPEYA